MTGPLRPAPNVGLFEMWREQALRATDAQLALLAGLIVPVTIAAGAVGMWKPRLFAWWPSVLVPLFLAAFGLWGLADRELRYPRPNRARAATVTWSALRGAATVLAWVCVAAATMLFLRLAIGTWIS